MNNKIPIGWTILKYVLAIFLIYAGAQHFINPDFFLKVIPPFLLKFGYPIVYISGVIEIAIGLLLLTKKYQKEAALAFALLMLSFLPLHIWDAFAENPFTGSQQNAVIRLVIQLVLITILWKLYKLYEEASESKKLK